MSYFQPSKLAEMLPLLADQKVKIIAGGTDFYPSLSNQPLYQTLLDVSRVEEMRGITKTEMGFRIGASTTWSEIATASLPKAFRGLQIAARQVGSLQIQNAGTIVGNICNASPAADGVPPLLTLDAEIEIIGQNKSRKLPLSQFILGVRKTALKAGECVAAIHIPNIPAHAQGSFEKLGSREYLVISIAMVGAVIGVGAQGTIDFARIAVGSCSPVAVRLLALEEALIGQKIDSLHIEDGHLDVLTPIDDVRASAAYRKEVVVELIKRSIENAMDAHE